MSSLSESTYESSSKESESDQSDYEENTSDSQSDSDDSSDSGYDFDLNSDKEIVGELNGYYVPSDQSHLSSIDYLSKRDQRKVMKQYQEYMQQKDCWNKLSKARKKKIMEQKIKKWWNYLTREEKNKIIDDYEKKRENKKRKKNIRQEQFQTNLNYHFDIEAIESDRSPSDDDNKTFSDDFSYDEYDSTDWK